jgi:hypothetical protein
MKCRYFKSLNKYLDNELDSKESAFFLEHLKVCPECGKELKIMSLLRNGLNNKKIDSNQEFFWQTLKSRISQEESFLQRGTFVFDLGNWAKKLVPVPVVIGIVAAVFLILASSANENLIDSYLFSSAGDNISSLSNVAVGNYSDINEFDY